MDAINKLLDSGRKTCSPATWAALADKLGVTPQLVSQWRNGTNPLSAERTAQIAELAGQDPAVWLVAVAAQQAKGKDAKGWKEAARRLGYAAGILGGCWLIQASSTEALAAIPALAITSHNVSFGVFIAALIAAACLAADEPRKA